MQDLTQSILEQSEGILRIIYRLKATSGNLQKIGNAFNNQMLNKNLYSDTYIEGLQKKVEDLVYSVKESFMAYNELKKKMDFLQFSTSISNNITSYCEKAEIITDKMIQVCQNREDKRVSYKLYDIATKLRELAEASKFIDRSFTTGLTTLGKIQFQNNIVTYEGLLYAQKVVTRLRTDDVFYNTESNKEITALDAYLTECYKQDICALHESFNRKYQNYIKSVVD